MFQALTSSVVGAADALAPGVRTLFADGSRISPPTPRRVDPMFP